MWLLLMSHSISYCTEVLALDSTLSFWTKLSLSLLSASLSVKKFHSVPPFSKTYNTVVSWMMLVISCHSSARLMFCMFVECHLRFNCSIFSLSALHNLCIIFLSPVFFIDYRGFFPAVLQACLIEFMAPKLSNLKTIYWTLHNLCLIFLSPAFSRDCINIYIYIFRLYK